MRVNSGNRLLRRRIICRDIYGETNAKIWGHYSVCKFKECPGLNKFASHSLQYVLAVRNVCDNYVDLSIAVFKLSPDVLLRGFLKRRRKQPFHQKSSILNMLSKLVLCLYLIISVLVKSLFDAPVYIRHLINTVMSQFLKHFCILW